MNFSFRRYILPSLSAQEKITQQYPREKTYPMGSMLTSSLTGAAICGTDGKIVLSMRPRGYLRFGIFLGKNLLQRIIRLIRGAD